MILSITGWFTVPNYRFDITSEFFKLLIDSFTPMVNEYVGKKIKEKELEIYLGTDGASETLKVVKRFEKNTDYLTYEFWLPYSKIVINKEVDLQVFVDEFVASFTEALCNFCIPTESITFAQQTIKEELKVNLEKYAFVLTAKEKNYRDALQKLKLEFANSRNKAKV